MLHEAVHQTMTNEAIARVLEEIADLQLFKEEPFKARAYREAARQVRELASPLAILRESRTLEDIPGIGKSIAAKITELIDTGHLKYLDELRSEIPAGLLDLIRLSGIGPKTAIRLHDELGINSIDELERKVKDGALGGLRGFGVKSGERILEAIRDFRSFRGRIPLPEALHTGHQVIESLERTHLVKRVDLAGSIRRVSDMVGDIDILAVTTNPAAVIDAFTRQGGVKHVIAKGESMASVLLDQNVQVDLRLVEESEYGAALIYFTGSKAFNIKLRTMAHDRGWMLNDHGLFDRQKGSRIAGADEKGIFTALGMDWIPPELREERGEIELAMARKLPTLVDASNVKGLFHVHTTWSEGHQDIEAMVKEARRLGLSYIAICDHGGNLPIARSMDPAKLRAQTDEIRRISDRTEKENGFVVFSGVEANIDKDGVVDIDKSLLKDLDIVIASIHSSFKLTPTQMTERLLSAIATDGVNVIGHPTGRVLNERPSYSFDLELVAEQAAKAGVALELNSYPTRLDLSSENCKIVQEAGAWIALGSDAHDVDQLQPSLTLGVAMARRGWLEWNNIVNCLDAPGVRAWAIK